MEIGDLEVGCLLGLGDTLLELEMVKASGGYLGGLAERRVEKGWFVRRTTSHCPVESETSWSNGWIAEMPVHLYQVWMILKGGSAIRVIDHDFCWCGRIRRALARFSTRSVSIYPTRTPDI